MEEADDDKTQIPSSKRMLSTEDPDYVHLPDAKRMKEMHRRAQDELSERVIKVVDKEFHYALNEKHAEMEEIDSRILRLQQCLHTLRYCVSLNYYAVNKGGEVINKQKQHIIHPSVRKHLGKAPIMQQTDPISDRGSFQHSLPSQSLSSCQNTVIGCLSQEECKESSSTVAIKEEFISSGSERIGHNPREGPVVVDGKCSNQIAESEMNQDIDKKSPRPLSPKYLPPNPPHCSQTIYQGRHQRFQSKKRVVVGNTYQFLTPHAGGEVGDALRYKWQVYVRAPTQDEDISTFISAVTFILDQSYAPHHIITLKHPPYLLSRRGWGEFKIQIVLRFADTRNKQVRLLHPLLLSRPDDPLALTGLWRLGQENWYDLWVYESNLEGTRNGESTQIKEMQLKEENSPATLIKELETGFVSSQVEDNITVIHSVRQTDLDESVREKSVKEENVGKVLDTSGKGCVSEHLVKQTTKSVVGNDDLSSVVYHFEKEIGNDDTLKKFANEESQTSSVIVPKVKREGIESMTSGIKLQETQSDIKVISVNGAQGKMCKIHVRQPDGRLVPYFIPAHMYSLALKIAQGSTKKQENQVNDASDKHLEQQGMNDQQDIGLKKVELHVLSGQTGSDGEVNMVKQEPDQMSAQQKGTKVAVFELKEELMHENSGVCSAPVKIVNFLPNKSAANDNDRSLSLTASTSGIQGMSRLPIVMQGKQTIAQLSVGRLSQNPVQHLVKAAIEDKRQTLVQRLLNKKGLKEGINDPLQTPQVIDAQASTGLKSNVQLMPLKIVKEMQATASASPKTVQKPISVSNIRFITSNGQLIASKLAKGKICPTSSKVINMNMTSCPDPPTSSCIFTKATSCVTSAAGVASDMVVMQGSPLMTTSSGLQLLTSKGKTPVTQLPSLMVCNSSRDTGTALQVPPNVVRGTGNDGTVRNISNSVNFSSSSKSVAITGVSLLRGCVVTTAVPNAAVHSLLKPSTITTTASGTSTTPVLTNVLPRAISSTSNVTSISHNVSHVNRTMVEVAKLERNVEDNVKAKNDGSTKEWEERVRQLETVCRACSSADACVYVWVRAMPLVTSHHRCSLLMPFCARSHDEFLQWPLPKQRAAEVSA
ncbi:uncharacterized protein [Panulirus ornatus]|uniref:uncharacterized protein isoform X1 n=1 Tax=Panulirus ornatus TaxID=150431 RepID=UPI003A8A0917